MTLGGAILQNALQKKLPQSFGQIFPGGASVALEVIPDLTVLPPDVLQEVRQAYADSLKVVWRVMTGLAGAGLLSSLIMRGLPLHTAADKDWGMVEKDASRDDVELKLTSTDKK